MNSVASFQVECSGGTFGASITGVDLAQPISADLAALLRAVWLDHQVVFFPDQDLTIEDLERITQSFGAFGEDPFLAPIPGHPHVIAINRDPDERTPIFAESWHSDWSFQPKPPSGTFLYGREIPPSGGDTLFANQYLAYESLPSVVKSQIATLEAVHSARRGYGQSGVYGEGDVGRSMRILHGHEAERIQRHPVVLVHPETGKRALFVNPGYTEHILHPDKYESRALLLLLHRWQTSSQFVYRHRWQPGMLVLWDNRAVLHKATGGYEGYRRRLWRTTLS